MYVKERCGLGNWLDNYCTRVEGVEKLGLEI